MQFSNVKSAISDFKKGKFLIVVDDRNRENEADLVLAAQKTTPEKINFMIRNARGLVCVPMLGERLDELKLPQKLEHFGISVVEAMASGAVPVVFDAGGHKEIVSNSESGYLWKTESELLAKTLELVSTKKRIKEMALRAQRESHKYSYARFKKEILELLN